MRARAIAFCASLAFLASFVLPCAAQGPVGPEAKPIGKVVVVTGSVTIEHAGAGAVLAKLSPNLGAAKVDDPVYIRDVIQAGSDGSAGIAFTDGTAFNISNNSRIVLDEFVYDPKGKKNSTVLSLTKGAFTLVAGNVAKTGSMKIETPAATMGIRGTTPHVEIAADGTVSFATLIEEGKRGVDARRRAGVSEKQRRADRQPDQSRDLDKLIDIKLKICRGC